MECDELNRVNIVGSLKWNQVYLEVILEMAIKISGCQQSNQNRCVDDDDSCCFYNLFSLPMQWMLHECIKWHAETLSRHSIYGGASSGTRSLVIGCSCTKTERASRQFQ